MRRARATSCGPSAPRSTRARSSRATGSTTSPRIHRPLRRRSMTGSTTRCWHPCGCSLSRAAASTPRSHQAAAAAAGLSAVAELGAELRSIVDGGWAPARTGSRRCATSPAAGAAEAALRRTGPRTGRRARSARSRHRAVRSTRRRARSSTASTAPRRRAWAWPTFFEGPGDYLLLAANNAQMQNGQGMFLSAGVLHVEDGRMDLGPMQSLDRCRRSTRRSRSTPTWPLGGDGSTRTTTSATSGSRTAIPVTADTATRCVDRARQPARRRRGGGRPGHARRRSWRPPGPSRPPRGEHGSDDVLEYVLHGQYEGYLGRRSEHAYTAERRDELDEIARTVLDAFEGVEDLEPEFLDAFSASAAGRHLLMWSSDPHRAGGVRGRRRGRPDRPRLRPPLPRQPQWRQARLVHADVGGPVDRTRPATTTRRCWTWR